MNKLFSKIATLSVGLAMAVGVGVALGQRGVQKVSADDTNAQIIFGNSGTKISSASVSGKDSADNTWTITTVGTTSFTQQPTYSQVGKSSEPATSVTLTTTLAASAPITGFEVKAGGFSGTEGDVVLKVGSTTVGEGSLNASSDVTVSQTSNASGTVLTVEFSSIAKGIKIYHIKYTIADARAVKNVVSVKEAPEYVYVGDTIETTDVVLNVVYDDDTAGTVTPTSVECDTSVPGNVKGTAYYNAASGTKSAQFDVEVRVDNVASIAAKSAFKSTFNVNEAFTFGPNAKITVTYDSSATVDINPTDEGVSVLLGELDITGMTYYMQKADKDKKVTISYAGKSFQYDITAVNDAEPVGEGYYAKVTDSSGLVLNSRYIIVSEQNGKALSTTQNTNNRAGTDVTVDTSNQKIDSISASVEVFTLVEGTVTTYSSESVTTYGFKTSDDKYIYAAGSGTNNRLKTSDTLTNDGSFMISFTSDSYKNSVITAAGDNTNRILRYNTNNNLFACYGSASQASVQLYKFVAQEKSDDEKAVDTFINTYMHLDDVSVNNHSNTGACKGETGYYALAKAAYLALTADQKAIFNTSAEFNVLRAKERLAAWAVANGETFDPAAGTFETSVLYTPVMNFENNAGYVIIIAVITLSAISLGVVILTHKRKHQ